MHRRGIPIGSPPAGRDPVPMTSSMSTGPQGSIVPREAAANPIDPGVRIGHVHPRTTEIPRVKDFYVGVMGFEVGCEARDVPGWGTTGYILFVAPGGCRHPLGFNPW